MVSVTTRSNRRCPIALLPLLIALLLPATLARAEDGYDLWMRYVKVLDPTLLAQYRKAATQIVVTGDSPTAGATRDELRRGLSGLLGREVPLADAVSLDGAVVVAVADSTAQDAAGVRGDGYRLLTKTVAGKSITLVSARTPLGGLYGAFGLLRLIQTDQPTDKLDRVDNPRIQRRLLNHWDHWDGHTAGKTYAGKSIWFSEWNDLPGRLDPRYTDYARANASVGINGTVLNDFPVNLLGTDDLKKVAALAEVFRPYGLRVYLSVNFASPLRSAARGGKTSKTIAIGDLDTADPRDPRVARWWKAKADEIYTLIPDFGGFVVKADSEGMPGPKRYGRDDAEAANMLAAALAPHGGIVMWRAFVYNAATDPDRAKRSYKSFVSLDGKFAPNVLLQVKHGPLDFQPREPMHPLWGAMPQTQLMMEFEIEQEYLGRATDLVYLGAEWQDILQTDTFAKGPGSTVARVVDGSLDGHALTGIAGVANIGDERNWCGHLFAQSNWYAFGRLAWNPDLSADAIADEWVRMTWSNAPKAVATIGAMMKGSWQAAIDVRSPLGLNFACARDHHNPDPASRVGDYWACDKNGVGYDRSDHPEPGWNGAGTNAVGEYHEPLRSTLNNLDSCPEEELLWFHFVPWDHKMASGRTLWEELCLRYDHGLEYAERLETQWQTLSGSVDADRFAQVAAKLTQQAAHSRLWRDTCLRFFAQRSGRPVPSAATASRGVGHPEAPSPATSRTTH